MGQAGSIICEHCPDSVLASLDGSTSVVYHDLGSAQEVRIPVPARAAIEDKQARQREAAAVATEIIEYNTRCKEATWNKFAEEIAVQKKVWEAQAMGNNQPSESQVMLVSQIDHILELRGQCAHDEALSVLRIVMEQSGQSFSTSIIMAAQGIFDAEELGHSRTLLAEQLEAMSCGEAANDTMRTILKAAKIEDSKLQTKLQNTFGGGSKKGGKNVRWN